MGEGDTVLDYQVFKKLYPIRKFAFIASIVFIVLSFLVVVECAFVLTDSIKFNSPVLISFSYFLASFLVLIGLIGLRYSYISANTVNECSAIVIESPNTSPIWLSTNIQQFADQDLLPGAVRPDGMFPPPPPRYSSLGDTADRNPRVPDHNNRNSANSRRTASSNSSNSSSGNEAKP
ncbi:hypothetical protein M3Y97_00811600 [Aphelenchoides bicaudatus]|nr:hypothetical protein M3Y97_00811600 [Aphelenchoides bicaudatus]